MKAVHFWGLFVAWLTLLTLVLLLPHNNFFPYSFEKDTGLYTTSPQFLWHLGNFDGAHYQNIASSGYKMQFQTAFFPLFPRLIGIFSNFIDPLLGSIVISLCCLILSLIIFNRLDKTFSSSLALISYPLAFFFVSSYTESLFLLLSLVSWYSYKQDKFFISGTFGFLAALTRFYGILLFPLLISDLYLKHKRLEKKHAYLFLIPLGLFVYMLYLFFAFNDPLSFVHSLSLWNKSNVTLPLQTVYRYIRILLTVSPTLHQYKIALLEVFSFTLGIFFSYILFKVKQFPQALYVLLGTLIPSLTGTLSSFPRYMMVLFPIYFICAGTKRRNIFYIFLLLCVILQVYLFKLFLSGKFVA